MNRGARTAALLGAATAIVAALLLALPHLLHAHPHDAPLRLVGPPPRASEGVTPDAEASSIAADPAERSLPDVAPPATTDAPTTVAPPPAESPSEPAPTQAAPTTQAPPTTSTTVCRQSTNPACGPFYWSPKPAGDKGVQISVTAVPAHPKVGQAVTLTVTVVDPDATPTTCQDWDAGDGTSSANPYGRQCPGGPSAADCAGRAGPWAPPPPNGGSWRYDITHTYTSAGQRTVRAFGYSDDGGSTCHPHGSAAVGALQLTVTR